MGFIDFDTMMELRDKILLKIDALGDRIEKLENRSDNHTLCNINFKIPSALTDDPFATPLLKGHGSTTLKASTKYTFCLAGNHFYYHKGNGNGFRAAPNDYLHQRKMYTDYEFTVPESGPGDEYFDWAHLLTFLFDQTTVADWISEDKITMSEEYMFPGCSVLSPCFQFAIDITPSAFDDLMSFRNWKIRKFKKVGDDGRFYDTNNWYYCYRGRVYIVENAFSRGVNSSGHDMGKFCERVWAYMHLIVSFKNVNNTSVLMHIGQLND